MCVYLPSGAQKRRHIGFEALRTSSHRTAAAVVQIAEQPPVRCFCGAAEFDYSFVRFPMLHVSRCRNCGLASRGELKVAPVKKKAAMQPPGAEPPVSFPPFWY
jgi:hypothetical protein